jgi:Na+/H+-dicarboxylate symporter
MMNDDTTTTGSSKKNCGFCALTQNHPILTILIFALIGVGVGVGLSFWELDDPNDDTKKITLQWIGLLGDLFLRSLKCFVLPLVFVNVIISVVDMMTIGKASSIGWTVIGLYLLTTVAAAVSTVVEKCIFHSLSELLMLYI